MDASLQGMGDLALSQAQATAKPAVTAANMTSIDKAAGNFEGMFMTQMIQPMFEGVGVDPVFGGGHGEEVMRSFLVQEFGKMASKSIGLAPAIKSEMIRMQAAASGGSSHTATGSTNSSPMNGV